MIAIPRSLFIFGNSDCALTKQIFGARFLSDKNFSENTGYLDSLTIFPGWIRTFSPASLPLDYQITRLLTPSVGLWSCLLKRTIMRSQVCSRFKGLACWWTILTIGIAEEIFLRIAEQDVRGQCNNRNYEEARSPTNQRKKSEHGGLNYSENLTNDVDTRCNRPHVKFLEIYHIRFKLW